MKREEMRNVECGMRNGSSRLRAINQPFRVKVEIDETGNPKTIGRLGGQAVEIVLDTWRIDDEWWRQSLSRRYYDVVLEGGKRVVLFEDLITGEWWMQNP